MLRAVGHPVAVNPDSRLRRVAREEGWEIMRFEQLGRRLKAAGARGSPPRWSAPRRAPSPRAAR